MKWKSLLWILPSIVVIFGATVWITWTYMNAVTKTTPEEKEQTEQTSDTEDFSTEVVNTPLEESIVVFNENETSFENGHDFISTHHKFYNETLGWGRIESESYERQKENAESILASMENIIEIKNEHIKKDFEAIQQIAQTVIQSDDRDAMRKLHRYFHDLDIYFNGYDYNQTFNITTFVGE